MKRGKKTMWGIGGWIAAGLLVCGGALSGVSSAQAIEITGYVDTSYTYNLSAPSGGTNTYRAFDTEINSFMLNNIEFVMQQPADKGVGYKVVLNYGSDADVVSGVTGVGATDTLDVQQGFVLIPVGGGELTVGKFATLHGAEVIESPANMNFSRSLLFNWAIPFTHTGVRYHYAFNEMLSGHIGVNNGWDVVKDNNSDKSVELQVGITPMPMLSLSLAGMMGGEPAGAPNAGRTLLDVVATIKPMDKLTIVLNYDYGTQDQATTPGSDEAKWSGIAGYINYAVNDQWSVAVRGETFDDEDGYRTCAASATTPCASQTLTEGTATVAYTGTKDTIIRAEYRHDSSDEETFVDNDGVATDSQDTVGVEFIYSF
ncbi:MAG: porin [Nitrospirae bacterium]|nr:porin [Nitrospirota bacterium]